MSNLYELTNNYETLLNMLYDEDADEEMCGGCAPPSLSQKA